MIDPQILRDDPDLVRESQRARGEDPGLVDRFLQYDTDWRKANAEYDRLRSEQKSLGREVGEAKRTGADASALVARGEVLAGELNRLAEARDAALAGRDEALMGLGNLVDAKAPRGQAGDVQVLSTHGTVPAAEAGAHGGAHPDRGAAADERGGAHPDHVEIGTRLGVLDVERGAKVSGSRFYFLTGQGALLELALVNYAMQVASSHGFTPVIAPSLVRPFAMEGTGFLGQAAENVYSLGDDDMYLVGTSEVALAAMHADEILPEVPIRYVGFSPCFRREAGSHGKDTRGIMRVHWFDKVEMFSFTNVDAAAAEHQKILGVEHEILQGLELPYRVVDIPTGDLGASAKRKFDCEVWVPSLGEYREVTSASDCGDFQARRLKIRRAAKPENEFVATLNGTAIAVPRIIIAILENHLQADGSVNVPSALRPFFGGRSQIVA
jgi:seryl-tRNA synthetase